MEKFGLFDLLAALMGEAEPAPPPPAGKEGKTEPAPPPRAQGVFSPEERRRRAEEALLRHDTLSRRIDRRKK